ncbi:ArsC family reductase [Alteromonas sp. MB-3u-76]|jgi:Spx/MgsR family transcriptional regulator|uniref:ArsC family reductase n=1 Tax=Alteromonas sp. MB-3u-76 TaxID=2058133 RepID=UPI000C315CAC|nr:ArsC family reductase [Alteromonas sp. MB-3u-76]AUC88889.1 ArsC family reductase [Alteromonas sp. MB-3u-76]
MSTVIYGIPNCDTIKKAKKWLAERDIEFTFHDYRKEGADSEFLQRAEAHLGWEVMLNKRGTTYRQLDEAEKATIDREKALALLELHPAMIKRPIMVHNNQFHIGFKPAQYEEIFC